MVGRTRYSITQHTSLLKAHYLFNMVTLELFNMAVIKSFNMAVKESFNMATIK